MKKSELCKRLQSLGWYWKREGSNHEIWTNGLLSEPISRHKEVSEILANKILKKAEKGRGE